MPRTMRYAAFVIGVSTAVICGAEIRSPAHRNAPPLAVGFDALARRSDWLSALPKTAGVISACYGRLMPFQRNAYVFRVDLDGDKALIWFATGMKLHVKQIICADNAISDMTSQPSALEADDDQERTIKPPYYADEARHLPPTNRLQVRRVIGDFDREQGVAAF